MLKKPASEDTMNEVDTLRKKITELEQANSQLLIFKDLFQIVIDAVPALIFWKDRHNNLLGCNKAYKHAFDVPSPTIPDTAACTTSEEPDKHLQPGSAQDTATLQGLPTLNIIEEVTTPHQKLWLKTDKIPYTNESGEVIGIMCISTNITPQIKDEESRIYQTQLLQQPIHEELESRITARVEELAHTNEELKRINTDLDNFIYTASHDLKSPLANMEGLVTILTHTLEGRLNKDDKVIIDMLQKSISRFKATIADLTQITYAQKDSQDTFEPLNFAEIIENVKTDTEQLIRESGARIIKDIQVPQIQYARKNLRSIIYNLLVNAMKYRSPEKTPIIRVRTRQAGDYIILSVQDNGLGMSAEQMANLFTMFKRIHTHVEGTGLGLYVIKRIIENTGGRIEAESEVGKGTTFKVYFRIGNTSSQAARHSSNMPFDTIK